jgi:hypothetical protein
MAKKPKTHSPAIPSSLKAEVHKAALAAARITGWAALDRPALVAAFQGRVPRSTLYRWLSEVEGSPLDRTTEELMRDARAGGRARVESVAGEVQARAAAMLPRVPSVEDCAAVTAPVAVMDKLRQCLTAAEDVMSKCRTPDGAVRNSKMLLLSAEQLRRSLETAVKLQEAISDGLQIDQFHKTIMEEIAKIDPAVAAQIAAKLLEVNAAWAGRQDVFGART